MTEPSSRRVALGTGLTYHVLEWGEDRPELDHTVVLLHGFLDLAWLWQRTVEAGLAGRFHVVAPDFRGHGDSDPVGPGGYYHFLDYLADLDELVARVARGRLSLVGFSMGGSVAAYFAGAFPERVEKLVLVEGLGPPDMHDEIPDRIRTWTDSWRRMRERPVKSYADLDEATRRVMLSDPRCPPDLARFLAERGTRRGDDGRLRFKHDPLHQTTGPLPFRVEQAAAFWRRVTCPVLLIDAADSEYKYGDVETARREGCFADRRKVVIADAGHSIARHQPAALAAALVDFLA